MIANIDNSEKMISNYMTSGSLVLNPTVMTMQTCQYINKTFSFDREIELIKNDLIRSELKTYAQNKQNEQFLYEMQDIIDSLPQLPEIHQHKLIIPEFEEINVEKGDTAEIKKFIRKVNYEFLGYHCNHKLLDKDCDMIYKNMSDLYKSDDYRKYIQFLENVAHCVYQIRSADKRNELWDQVISPTGTEVKRVIDSIVNLAGQISAYNAKMNPECSKCKAALRKYNYAVKEVKRMRDEMKEQNEIDDEFRDKPAEDKMNMKDFMMKNYPSIDDFLLSDVKDKYKKTFGIVKTFAELTDMINETKMFKVTNIHRVYHVKRL